MSCIKKSRLVAKNQAHLGKVELENELKVIISESTIRRRLHEVGLYGRVVRKKLYVNKVNRRKRLEYAKNYREKPLGF